MRTRNPLTVGILRYTWFHVVQVHPNRAVLEKALVAVLYLLHVLALGIRSQNGRHPTAPSSSRNFYTYNPNADPMKTNGVISNKQETMISLVYKLWSNTAIHSPEYHLTGVLLLGAPSRSRRMVNTPQTCLPSRGEDDPDTPGNREAGGHLRTMAWISLPIFAVLAGVHVQWLLDPAVVLAQAQTIPAQAQVIDQRSFNGRYLSLQLA